MVCNLVGRPFGGVLPKLRSECRDCAGSYVWGRARCIPYPQIPKPLPPPQKEAPKSIEKILLPQLAMLQRTYPKGPSKNCSTCIDPKVVKSNRLRPSTYHISTGSLWIRGHLLGILRGSWGTLDEFGVPVGLIEGRFRVLLGGSWD